LVWVFYTLIFQKQSQLVPFGVMLWVFAASQFTATGAQANPAVTLGLMFSGRLTINDGGMLVIAQLVGIVVAMAVINLLTRATGKKKAKKK
jgi:glycerol uptake facilitator-like aquaporin